MFLTYCRASYCSYSVHAGWCVCASSDNCTKLVCVLGVSQHVCVFGSRLLPLVSEVFHSEPDEIPPASTAAIRQRIMQASPQAKTHTCTDTGGFPSVCVCVWLSSVMWLRSSLPSSLCLPVLQSLRETRQGPLRICSSPSRGVAHAGLIDAWTLCVPNIHLFAS